MANQVMNFARGAIGYYHDPLRGTVGANARIVLVVLEASQADDDLNNYDELDALLTHASNTEATSTNYARIELAAAALTWTVDDTGNDAQAIVDADQVWTTVSQLTSEIWDKLLMCYDADNGTGDDSDIIVLSHHDFVVEPNGGNITANFDQVAGYYGSV